MEKIRKARESVFGIIVLIVMLYLLWELDVGPMGARFWAIIGTLVSISLWLIWRQGRKMRKE